MNKLYHCGRIQNLLVSINLTRVASGSSGYYNLPSAGVVLPLQRYLPLEMFYLKRYYQSFKIHSYKVSATVYSAAVPANASNLPCRIAIAADYIYRPKFFATSGSTTDNFIGSVIDYSDMMELPNTKTRDILLSNLNNGSTISTIVRPARGCFNPNISTDRLETATVPALQDFDTEHNSVGSNGISKASNAMYIAAIPTKVIS